MRLALVSIRNVLGIEELEFSPGALTVIEGKNGSGKTSALEAIRAVTKGGQDATLLRKGATEGEVVLLFDDETRIRKRVTEKSQTVTFTDESGRQQPPMSAIKAIADAISLNPVSFLQAPAKMRVNVLLESLPMQADPERIRAIVGDPTFAIVGDHALKQIDNAHTVIYDERTGTNRARHDKEGAVRQLAAALPPAAASDSVAGADEDELRATLAVIDSDERAEMQRIDTKLGGIRDEHNQKVAGWRQQISDLERQITEETQAFSRVSTLASEQRTIATRGFEERRRPLNAALAVISADREAAIRAKQTRETIAKYDVEIAELEATSQAQTQMLEHFAAYKTELLQALPIKGLEVLDGEIYRDGVAFDRLNKAQQVEIAIEIAKLRAGEMKVICVDDLEMLDPEHFEAFREQALASGLQLIVTRVSGGEFAVRAEG